MKKCFKNFILLNSILLISATIANANNLDEHIKERREGYFKELEGSIFPEQSPAYDEVLREIDRVGVNKIDLSFKAKSGTLTEAERERYKLAGRGFDADQGFNAESKIFLSSALSNNVGKIKINELKKIYDMYENYVSISTATNPYKGYRMSQADFILKPKYMRGRPHDIMENGEYKENIHPKSGTSFPSGHTWNGFKVAGMVASIFPERGDELFSRALQYGESRVVLGVHFPSDTIASRVGNYFYLSKVYSDDKMLDMFVKNAREVRNVFGKEDYELAEFLRGLETPLVNEYKKDGDKIGYYGLTVEGVENTEITKSDIPKDAASLLRLRFPYLSEDQRHEMIASTAYPRDSFSNAVMKKGWGLINLPKAFNGYSNLSNDIVINQSISKRDELGNSNYDLGDFSNNDVWKNDIIGNGSIKKQGDGKLTLAGENSFNILDVEEGSIMLSKDNTLKNTKIQEKGYLEIAEDSKLTTEDSKINGQLKVNGTFEGEAKLYENAILSGNGYVGKIYAHKGSTVSPGNSIGTIKSDSVVFDKDSTYDVEVDKDGKSDKIIADKIEIQEGANLTFRLEGDENHISVKDAKEISDNEYEILNSKDITGKFDKINPYYIHLATKVSHDEEKGKLTVKMDRNDISFSDATKNVNEISVAKAVDQLLGTSEVYKKVLFAKDASEAKAKLDSLNPQIHSEIITNTITQSKDLINSMNDRLVDNKKSNTISSWINVSRNNIDINSIEILKGNNSRSNTINLGIEKSFNNDKLGIIMSSSTTDLDTKNSSNYANNKALSLGLYAKKDLAGLNFNTGISSTLNNINTERSENDVLANYTVNGTQGFVGISKDIENKYVDASIFGNVSLVNTHQNTIQENGNSNKLIGKVKNQNNMFTDLGMNINKNISLTNKTSLKLEGGAAWEHKFGNDTFDTDLSFENGEAFKTTSAKVSKDKIVLKAGAELKYNEKASIYAGYSNTLAKNQNQSKFDLGINLKF